nr:copia protein [Tanacetum cinerariifolium]
MLICMPRHALVDYSDGTLFEGVTTSVDEIRIDDSSRYPPDDFLHKDDPSRQYQALFDISYYTTPHNHLLAELTQTTNVPEVITLNKKTNHLTKDTKGKIDIGSKWVFKNKKDKLGTVIIKKARLVAQGYSQEERIEYDETFSPVARMEAIRIFLAFATYINFKVFQIDVKSAFLNGKLQEEVYVKNLMVLRVVNSLTMLYPKCSGFDLKEYSDSDYVGCDMDRKSSLDACQLLGVLYQNYLGEFWCIDVVNHLTPSSKDSDARPLKESNIKFTVKNVSSLPTSEKKGKIKTEAVTKPKPKSQGPEASGSLLMKDKKAKTKKTTLIQTTLKLDQQKGLPSTPPKDGIHQSKSFPDRNPTDPHNTEGNIHPLLRDCLPLTLMKNNTFNVMNGGDVTDHITKRRNSTTIGRLTKNTKNGLWEFYVNGCTKGTIGDLDEFNEPREENTKKTCSDTFYKPYLDAHEANDIYEAIDKEYSSIPIPAHRDINNPDELCQTKEFVVVQYSVKSSKEYIDVGPSKTNTVEKLLGSMSCIYRELFNKKDCGWSITRCK